MIYLILLGLTFIIQLFASVWFVMVETQQGRKPAFKFKLLCALIFIADSLLCVAMTSGYTSPYFILLFIGAILFFTGDILASASEDSKSFLLFILRSCGNLLYLAAYIYGLIAYFNIDKLRLPSILTALIPALMLIPFMCKKKGKYKPYLVFSVVSSLLMLWGAIYMGILCQSTGIATMQSVSFVVSVGAVAVALSQLLHTRQQISPPPALKPQLPKYCMYFFGQMGIACSIIICGGFI